MFLPLLKYNTTWLNLQCNMFFHKYSYQSGSYQFFQGIIGYFTFIPKYFEYHFRQKASTVGATGGLSQSVSSAVGILVRQNETFKS